MGTGSYVPSYKLTNEEISKMVETDDEWIVKRVGIKSRNIAVDETTSDMAVKAALNALENSGVKPEELDMIIVATITPDKISPSVACNVQNTIKANCPSFDISAACSGFIYAMESALAHLSLGKYKKILVIGSERMSSIIDWTDRGTCIIFGDGAGAVVISNEAENMLAFDLKTIADTDGVINITNNIGTSPFYKHEGIDERKIYMNGKDTYRFATASIYNDITAIMQEANLTNEDIKWVIPHQANIRIIKEGAKRLPIDKEKFCSNIDKTGNTSGASIAILLDELNRAGKLERGDILLFTAFGGGLSSGSMAIRW